MAPDYVELRAKTCFSFLRGASHPEELVVRAAELGYRRIAIVDDDGLYGVARAHRAAEEHGLEVIVGSEIHFVGPKNIEGRPDRSARAPGLVLLATDRKSYGRLSRLITLGRTRVGKGGFHITLDDVEQHAEGLVAIHTGISDAFTIAREKEIFGDRLALSIERHRSPLDKTHVAEAQSAAARFGLPLVVTGGVLMHEAGRKPMQDILSCIRLGMRMDEAGRRLLPNRNAHLKSPDEMAELFYDMPEALQYSRELADRCAFRLGELHQNFAIEVLPTGETPMTYLRKLIHKGAHERYPLGIPEDVRKQLEHEIKLIDELDFAGYFLTVWDIVRFARSQNILCQGRGSAANSVVCYALGITSIDPVRMNLLFERFISVERGEPPDIDVDFEHERREEVMQYVFQKYGRENAAMVANLICYRTRLSYREVGKVFGLGEDQIGRITDGLGHWSASDIDDDVIANAGLDPTDDGVQKVVRWAETLRGFPRHLGIHSGGFVITRDPLVELVPVENATMENRTVVAWDKRDVEALGLVKVDLLSLGMLTALHRAFDMIRDTEGLQLDLANIPSEVEKVYDMIGDADTVGTFQVESRAQMQMLPRLRPRTFYDLVVAVAIVRPGPIQGDMVHPYLRRRDGLEPIDYPHPALEEILGRTYGVPLFQEQVMKMAVAIAGFTPGESDELRRAIGWMSQVHIDRLKERLIRGMLNNGLKLEYAERIFRMIQGFGGYGFPESHAASFALIGYASCYLKRFHPAAFATALLNSQPMGFYAPHTLVADAERHGVEVRAPCILESQWDAKLEAGREEHHRTWWEQAEHKMKYHCPWADHMQGELQHGIAVQPAVRLGFRSVNKMGEALAERIVEARQERPFSGVADVMARAALPRDIAARLAAGDAFSCFGLTRREAMWRVMDVHRKAPLFAGVEPREESTALPTMTPTDAMRADYSSLGLSVGLHPIALIRPQLKERGITSYLDLEKVPHGKRVRVGGIAVTRQRPGTASGVIFMTLEDEHGHMNLVIFTKVYDRYRTIIRGHPLLLAEGEVQRTGKVINVIVERVTPLGGEELADPQVAVGRHFF